jgi:hypothetical protein
MLVQSILFREPVSASQQVDTERMGTRIFERARRYATSLRKTIACCSEFFDPCEDYTLG